MRVFRYMHYIIRVRGGRRSKENILLDCKSLSLKNGTSSKRGIHRKLLMKEQKLFSKKWAFFYRCFLLLFDCENSVLSGRSLFCSGDEDFVKGEKWKILQFVRQQQSMRLMGCIFFVLFVEDIEFYFSLS